MHHHPPSRSRLVPQIAPGLPVAKLILGREAGAVMALLPKVFNLCRAAQGAAVAVALDQPVQTDDIHQEVLRDHLFKFYIAWPGHFGMGASALPGDWAKGGHEVLRAIFGPCAQAPKTPADFAGFMNSDAPLAAPLRRIRDCFDPQQGVANGLAVVTASSIWSDTPVENSVAARHINHPVMQDLQSIWGRGPLWRAAARLFDIECAARAELPAIQSPGKGCAIVPATRGSYAIKIRTDNSAANHVTSMDRRTPTDALLAKNGILDRVLDSLPVDKFSLSPLIMDILDPCSPVRLREVQNA